MTSHRRLAAHSWFYCIQMNHKDIYDDFKLKKTFWSPWFILKYFSASRVKMPIILQVCEYHHVDWMGSLELGNELEEFKAITMESDVNVDGQNKQLSLSIHINCDTTMDLYLYSPYWLVNKTGLPIMIRVCLYTEPF